MIFKSAWVRGARKGRSLWHQRSASAARAAACVRLHVVVGPPSPGIHIYIPTHFSSKTTVHSIMSDSQTFLIAFCMIHCLIQC
jgi:hypothetical protein